MIKDGKVLGNLVATIDFNRYFSRVFAKYNLEQYQWQWLMNDTGMIVFDNHGGEVAYSQLRNIQEELDAGTAGWISHRMETKGTSNEIISAFYPINMFGIDFGLVFSAPTDFFQKYIFRNAIIMLLLLMTAILFIIWLFQRHLMKKHKQFNETSDSESTLLSILEQMPVGLLVYNKNREIQKANRHAATLFSYNSEDEMTGKLVPDMSRNDYESDLDGQNGQGRIIRLPGQSGDRLVFLNSIPVDFRGDKSTLEVLIDVTALKSARKQEADANIAKSELLARMSFEIRTPLNGIIGMTEMLNRSELPEQSKEVARLLRRSADLLLTIINDIFDVSKVETGKMILDEVPIQTQA